MKHLKKMIAPIIITAISLVYLIAFGVVFVTVPGLPLWLSVTGGILWLFCPV